VLDQAEALELEEALDVEGVSDEIALLRVKIHSLLKTTRRISSSSWKPPIHLPDWSEPDISWRKSRAKDLRRR
jgi:hypothetical protein